MEGFGKEANFVQEERAPVRGLKEAGLGPASVGKGTLLEAEQLGFEERLRDRRTVDGHKRAAPSGPQAMDEPGHEPLAGASFTLDENRREAPANLLAVDGQANQDKGDSPPAQWMPPNAAFACQYAMQFIAVLRGYSLPVDLASTGVLRQAATTCPTG